MLQKLSLLCSMVFCIFGATAQAEPTGLSAKFQSVIDAYLQQRAGPEKISGVALHVDIGDGPVFDVYSGTDGHGRPVDGHTLFQIGSNTKHFTAALILALEAKGLLNINQTVGDWLPQYRQWRGTTIRSLLNMTSPIPNYSETQSIGQAIAADIHHQFTPQQLIAAAYDQGLPEPSGWFYSNTNNILTELIIEAASGMSYKQALKTLILEPLALRNTYYSNGPYSTRVLARLPVGIYDNQECLLYQPRPCSVSTLAPLIGQDVSTGNLSWAASAGAIISNPTDLAHWIRDLFGLKLFPQRQLDEMTTLVSQKTGLPIKDTSADNPSGFGLDLGRIYKAPLGGSLWFYEGETLGFRVIFAYWPQYDLVMTTATNSQPNAGEDQLGPLVLGGAFSVLDAAGAIKIRQ